MYNGFNYQKNKKTSNAIYWWGWRHTCRAGLQTNCFNVDLEEPRIEVRSEAPHNHADDEEVVQQEKCVSQLKKAIGEDATKPVKRVYNTV